MQALAESVVDVAAWEVAKHYYSSMKDQQLQALVGLVSGRDTFASLPTWYGKTYAIAVMSLPDHCNSH